jgi:hypothetical protein
MLLKLQMERFSEQPNISVPPMASQRGIGHSSLVPILHSLRFVEWWLLARYSETDD